MPHFIHERAKHILAKNPDMEEGLAFALATQQSHALGKSPKGYGTAEGRKDAKKKYQEPKAMERTANPGKLKTEKLADALQKFAFVEALPVITGLASGYGPGRNIAGETAAAVAPKGRVHRSENIARNAAVIGVPLGGLAAMALAHKYKLAPRLADFAANHFDQGLISDPDSERELIRQLLPGAAAIGGSLVGGAATGGVVGGLQRLRGAYHPHKEKSAALAPSPMWSRIGGAASKRPVWMAQSGFTPTGFKTPAQRLSKSMDMGTVDGSKGLKPLDFGKMQQKAQQQGQSAVKMGMVMLAITKTATGQKIPIASEKEDAETGDENEPGIAKAADDGGHGGFSTNAYSGVMNPPAMKYTSGIPPWQEPPVKTAGPPSEKMAFSHRVKTAGFLDSFSSAPDSYVAAVSKASGIPEDHVRPYVRNIRPQRFMVTPEEFATDLQPVYDIKEKHYNPLQQGLVATAEGSPEEKAYLAQHGKSLDGHYGNWMIGHVALRKKYTGTDAERARATQQLDHFRNYEQLGKAQQTKMAAGITPLGRLNSSKAIGAPRLTAAPGPSIAQIAKPKGFGMPMSGAKKGNNII